MGELRVTCPGKKLRKPGIGQEKNEATCKTDSNERFLTGWRFKFKFHSELKDGVHK